MSGTGEGRPLDPILSIDELYKNNPELKKDDIAHLQAWMSKQPHLPTVPDEILVPLLFTNNYSLERTKHSIENHFTIRTHVPELFGSRDPTTPEAQKQLSLVQAGHTWKKSPDGTRVWFIRLKPGESPANQCNFDILIKLGMMLLDCTLREDPTCSGHTLIADAKGLTMAHVAALKISTAKRFLKYVQEGLNVRLKAVHVINISSVVDYLFNLLKPFLNKELIDKIHMHSGPVEDLYKHIPKEILPKEYGGEMGDMDEIFDYSIRKVRRSVDWLVNNEYNVDEKKRPGKSKTSEDIFGLEGSFKKLDVD